MNDIDPPESPPRNAFDEWKRASGLSEAEIATAVTEKTGTEVKRAMIGALLRGSRNAGPAVAVALAHVTGLPTHEFMLPALAALRDDRPAGLDATPDEGA